MGLKRLFAGCLASLGGLLALGCPAACSAGCPITEAGHCIQQYASDGSLVSYPKLHWTPIARMARSAPGQGFQLQYLQGGASKVTRHASAAALATPGQWLSGLFFQPPGGAPIAFARFAPGSNLLRIDLLRIEKGIDGAVTVSSAVYGPHHADRFLLSQRYLSPSEQRSQRPGLNPLAHWKSDQDNLFHNICFQCLTGTGGIDTQTSGAATALGIAMQQTGAQLGILAVAQEWFEVEQDSSGGLLWSSVTTKIRGYARPDWWIASPIGAQVGGNSALGICAVANEQPCASDHTVLAGITLAPWAGPQLPTDKDLLYYSESSQSGFTVLGYSLITAALVGAGSYLWGGELLGGGGAGDAVASTSNAAGLFTGSAAQNAIFSGASYLGTSDVLHPGAPNRIQDGYLGASPSSGVSFPLAGSSGPAGALRASTNKLQVQQGLNSGLTGTTRLYQGGCPAEVSSTRCNSSERGTVPRLKSDN